MTTGCLLQIGAVLSRILCGVISSPSSASCKTPLASRLTVPGLYFLDSVVSLFPAASCYSRYHLDVSLVVLAFLFFLEIEWRCSDCSVSLPSRPGLCGFSPIVIAVVFEKKANKFGHKTLNSRKTPFNIGCSQGPNLVGSNIRKENLVVALTITFWVLESFMMFCTVVDGT